MMINKKHIKYIAAFCVSLLVSASVGYAAERHQSLLEEFIALTHEPVDEIRQKLDDTINAMAQEGDAVIPEIMDAFNVEGQRFGTRHAIVRVLAKIGSDEAKEQLKQVALSKREDIRSNMKEWAASHFIKLIQAKEEAISLLDSNEMGVKNLGLLTIAGIRLDDELLSKIEPLVTSQDRAVRRSAARVFELDLSEKFFDRKVNSLLTVLNNLYVFEDPNEISRPGQYNNAQISLQCYINAFSNMKGPMSILQQKSNETPKGLAKDVLSIARANRDDSSAKADIITLIKNPDKNYILRMRALLGMEKIGAEEDIPVLQALANTDPFQEKRMSGSKIEMAYPVREIAKNVIQRIQERKTPN
jgi:HEAT repeat protein